MTESVVSPKRIDTNWEVNISLFDSIHNGTYSGIYYAILNDRKALTAVLSFRWLANVIGYHHYVQGLALLPERV